MEQGSDIHRLQHPKREGKAKVTNFDLIFIDVSLHVCNINRHWSFIPPMSYIRTHCGQP